MLGACAAGFEGPPWAHELLVSLAADDVDREATRRFHEASVTVPERVLARAALEKILNALRGIDMPDEGPW